MSVTANGARPRAQDSLAEVMGQCSAQEDQLSETVLDIILRDDNVLKTLAEVDGCLKRWQVGLFDAQVPDTVVRSICNALEIERGTFRWCVKALRSVERHKAVLARRPVPAGAPLPPVKAMDGRPEPHQPVKSKVLQPAAAFTPPKPKAPDDGLKPGHRVIARWFDANNIDLRENIGYPDKLRCSKEAGYSFSYVQLAIALIRRARGIPKPAPGDPVHARAAKANKQGPVGQITTRPYQPKAPKAPVKAAVPAPPPSAPETPPMALNAPETAPDAPLAPASLPVPPAMALVAVNEDRAWQLQLARDLHQAAAALPEFSPMRFMGLLTAGRIVARESEGG